MDSLDARIDRIIQQIKKGLTSSPVLEIFDPDKPTFLKTDLGVKVMCWILMQTADDDESQQAIKLLRETGESIFDLSKNGALLRPLAFGSWSCKYFESKYHSFVWYTECGR